MKTPEDYLKEEMSKLHDIDQPYFDNNIYDGYSESIIKAIKAAQIDAINETVELCAENADLSYAEYEWEIPEGVIQTGDSEYGYRYINKDSILNCAKILIDKL